MSKGTVIYLPHGGGPFPVLGGMDHEKLISFLKSLGNIIPRPEEILVISAHWEEAVPTVINHPSPTLLYDYYGFPEQAYNIEYPAPGHPELAETIVSLLSSRNIQSGTEKNRGMDHGVFIPLKLIYPEADIPVTQLSLKSGLDAGEHLRIGKALKDLMERNILIIGSGFSFHNMQRFSVNGDESSDPANEDFQNWLIDTCCNEDSAAVREARLIQWASAPHGRYCHPREEHLLPLHLCQGITGTKGEVLFDDYVIGKRAIAIKW